MLKFMRRNASGAWVKVMFLSIVAVFIFWGFGAGLGGGKHATAIAKVNGRPIEQMEFQRTYANLTRMYQDAFKDLQPEMLKSLDVKGKAIDQLVRVELLKQEAERLGLQASDNEVRDSISTMEAFHPNGRFDKDHYLRLLRSNNLTPAEFEESKREELLVDKLQDLITAGVQVTEAETRDRFAFENDKVMLNYVAFKPADFANEVTVTEDELKAHYEANQEKFREPQRVRIEYIKYAEENFLPKAEVSDSEVQEYFNAHGDEFSQPERVHARHILFKMAPTAAPELKDSVRKKAEEVLAKAKAGGDFAALAKENSEDSANAANGGDLGSFARGQMVPAFEAVAFSLTPGQISELVETPFGLHIIKSESKEAAKTQSIDEARPVIVAKLKREKAVNLARRRANDDSKKAAAGDAFSDLALASGLTVNSPTPFGQGEKIDGLDEKLVADAALKTEPDNTAPVIETPQGFIMFHVTKKIESFIPPLSEVHSKVEASLKLEKAGLLAKSKAEAFLEKAKQSNMNAASAAAGLKMEDTADFTRPGNIIPGLGASTEIKKVAFELQPDKPLAPTVFKVGEVYVIVNLAVQRPMDEGIYADQKANLRTQVENRRKTQVMEEFLNYLKARANIEINDTMLAMQDVGVPRRR